MSTEFLAWKTKLTNPDNEEVGHLIAEAAPRFWAFFKTRTGLFTLLDKNTGQTIEGLEKFQEVIDEANLILKPKGPIPDYPSITQEQLNEWYADGYREIAQNAASNVVIYKPLQADIRYNGFSRLEYYCGSGLFSGDDWEDSHRVFMEVDGTICGVKPE